MDAIEILKQIELFSDLQQDELELLASVCRGESYSEGEMLFDEGDAGSSMCIVADGSVDLIKSISQGVDKNLLHARKGMVFGEASFIDKKDRSAKAVAAEDCMIITVDRDAFIEAASTSTLFSKIYLKISSTLADRLRLANDLMKETLIWGLEAAGGEALNLDKVITDSVNITLDLIDGKTASGKILKVEQSKAGYELTVKGDDDKLFIVPYHAVTRINI